MMKNYRPLLYGIFLPILIVGPCCAGVFSSGTIYHCDTNYFTATVSGVGILHPPSSGIGYSLDSLHIEINSDHPQTLKILLRCPAGVTIVLSAFNGNGGQNYTGCVFRYAGFPSITTGTAPFTGYWTPQTGSFASFNGYTANGTWTLTIIDTACLGFSPGGGGGIIKNGWFDGTGGGSGGGGIGFASNAGPLPVTLANFQGERRNNDANLKWVTYSELNNNYFEIERSTDGVNFRVRGRIMGYGTSFEPHIYSFQDNDLPGTLCYYRLKQVDYNGMFCYSKTIAINYHPQQSLSMQVFPNPTSNGTFAIVSSCTNGEEKATYSIQDITGRIVQSGEFSFDTNGNGSQIITASVKPGSYVITLVEGNSKASSMLIVQR